MEACYIPIELFWEIGEYDWRAWRGLVLACRALNALLRPLVEIMQQRSISIHIDSIDNLFKTVYYKWPNGLITKIVKCRVWPEYYQQTDVKRRFCDKAGICYTETVLYRDGRIFNVRCNQIGVHDRYLWTYWGSTREYTTWPQGQKSCTREVSKSAVIAQLKVLGLKSFILQYLPEWAPLNAT